MDTIDLLIAFGLGFATCYVLICLVLERQCRDVFRDLGRK